ncbi:DusB1: tRNA-dihydrouridine synthase B [Desulfococcus multivorans]|jgi:nifR3 family TIM-barrel protein|nr:DusB1: tRNA-dihydrouridine synthase B [Desulfococcus multivorans]
MRVQPNETLRNPMHPSEAEDVRALLNRPIRVGGCIIPKRLFLAPLSKLGNVAFRELVSEFGGFGLLFSEMTGSRSVAFGGGPAASGFMWRAAELPHLVCQLYGDEPAVMALAAERVAAEGFMGVDINFGCAVAAVCKHNCGAALLRDPLRAEKIVSAVRKAVSVPLFVKFRTGWEDDVRTAVDLARRFADAGADALTYHPRVAPDRRTRPPKWAYIGMVKSSVDIPVIGNGNVFDIDDCRRMISETGCDGVAIGRIAVARPWTFAQWTDGVLPDDDVYRRCALGLIDLLGKHFDESTAIRRYYKFSNYFAANFKFGHTFYAMVHKAKSMDALREAVAGFFETAPEIASRPRITMLR